MCGIAGVVTADAAAGRQAVERMNRRQMHRGPDHAVVVDAASVVLGNTRLAINDLSPQGNQPFRSPSGRYVVVFNGEIYNFVELQSRFCLDLPSGNDGAVIPALWERFGPASLRELRGMFAVAVVDTLERSLTLARDPFGIKPLAWMRTPDGVAFASEPRALALAAGSRAPSRQALMELFRFGAAGPETAPFDDMHVVAPGTWIRFDAAGRKTGGGPVLEGDHPLVPEDTGGTGLACLLHETVGMHLRSDVPVALLLSGGVDSALLARAARGLGFTLDCVTVTTAGDDDEAFLARRTAGLYRHRHHTTDARLDDAMLDRFFASMQRPSVDGLNTFVVTRAVADSGFKVALSGLGGDEALGGYRHFRLLRLLPLLRRLDHLPSGLQRALVRTARRSLPPRWDKRLRLLEPDGPRTPAALGLLQRELYPAARVAELFGAAVFEEPEEHSRTAEGFIDLVEAEIRGYLQTTLLPDADAFSMAHSVELRVPFLDVPLFGATAWASVEARGRGQKEALVRVAGDMHIRDLASRPKRGFTVPVSRLVDHRCGLMQGMADPTQPLWSWADRNVARAMLQEVPEHRWAGRWAFVVANAWLHSVGRDN